MSVANSKKKPPTKPSTAAPSLPAGVVKAAGPQTGNTAQGTTDAAQKAQPNTDPSPQAAGSGAKRSQMEQDFDRLRLLDKLEDGVDAVGPRGLAALCSELGIRDGEVDMLTVVWRIGATQSMCITRSEWLHAMYLYKIEHMGQLKNYVPQWRSLIKEDEVAFAEMYFHAYDFVRGDDEKLLPLEKGLRAWTSLLPESKFPFLSQWAQWVTVEYKRPISRDLWRMLLEFAVKVKDLEKYDPNDKWPTALDDFVEWMLEKQKAAVAAKVPKQPAAPPTH
jgi:hypothetical protein